jgi:hypothetical protein
MAKYAQINPGKYHLGYRFPTPALIERLPMNAEDEHRIDLKFKHSVVVGRTVYVGNVQVFAWRNGSIRVEADSMYKSIVNQFDTFASYNKIEAAVNDGEEITALAEFADRILQFKQNTLYIINVSQQVEILESTHKFKGVNNPAAVCKTDYGIAWVNEHGCYLYDGKNVTDLLEKQGLPTIKQSDWAGSIITPMIGYLPSKRQLFIVEDVGASGTGIGFIYDLVTRSWIKVGAARFNDAVKSNFINDWDGNLMYSTSDRPHQWSDTPAASANISLRTKDIDFGHPGVRKKIYKVYMSYKGTPTQVEVQYAINGDTDTLAPFYRTSSPDSNGLSASDNTNSDTTPLLSVGTDDWVMAELKPVSSINNVYSFQLVFDGTGAANFEVNDISIVYRLKRVK